MATDTKTGQINIRAQFFDKVIKQVAARAYKFKQAVTISPTSAWKNFFFRESTTVLTGGVANAVRGIPRGADFPTATPIWERISSSIEKFGLEDSIPWEDLLSDEIDVQSRILFKISEGVAKSVDDQIFAILEENYNGATAPSNINYILVGKAGSSTNTSGSWDQSSAAIIDDLLNAKQLITEANYDTAQLMAFVNPKSYRRILKYITDKGAQFPSFSNEIASNGRSGMLAGIQLVVSNSVTNSQALIVVPQRCATWKELVPLQTTTKEDPYKSLTVRAVEMGVTQLTDPLAVCLISGIES